MNWKQKVQDFTKRQDIEAEAQKIKNEDAEVARRNQHRADEEARKLANLQRHFKCHICGKLPIGPLVTPDDGDNGEGRMFRQGPGIFISWNIPNNLIQCKKCHEWACEDHIYKDICQTCAEKLV